MSHLPPNLRALFGDRYRVTLEPAATCRAKKADRWLMQIPCRGKGVTVYPHGDGLLAVECDHRRFLAKKLVALGLRLHQDGDEEKTFVFPVEIFDKVARIVKPLRRRVLTDEQRAAKAKRMEAVNANKIGPFRGAFASGDGSARFSVARSRCSQPVP